MFINAFYLIVTSGFSLNCWSNPMFLPTVECWVQVPSFRCPKSDINELLLALFAFSPSVTVSNIANHSILQTGFLVGQIRLGMASVSVSLDGGPYSNALINGLNWRYQLPAQAVTGTHWNVGTKHTISVIAADGSGNRTPPIVFTVIKGINHDTDGDGFSDVVITAVPSNAVQGYGLVFLAHGNTGLPSSSPDSILTDGLAGGSYFGDRIGVGDFNGDGYADIVVGSQAAPGFSTFGYVYIFHSSGQSGVTSQNINTGGTYNSLIKGHASGDRLGSFVMGGDLNNDGYDDAILTSPWSGGLGYVIYSLGTAGVPSKDLSVTSADITYNFGGNDDFGLQSAVGDINADGYTDLVVSAPTYNAQQGRLYIFVSNSGAIPGAPQQYLLGPTSPAPGCTAGTGCNFGSSFVLADFNGDSCADLGVGGNTFNTNQGIVFVFNSNCGSVTPYSSVPNATLIGPALATCTGGTNCSFGSSVSTGDTNGDGYSDLFVGAYLASAGYGNAYLFRSPGSIGFSNVDLSSGGTASSVLTGSGAGLNFGIFTALQDITGDGMSDLLVSASTGAGTVFYFKSTGVSGPGNQNLSAGGIATSVLTVPFGQNFGNAIALNRDGSEKNVGLLVPSLEQTMIIVFK
ncbi:FG-GAP repeat protein [Leptospira broomii serovar Hurstbridge str. 5399]|uniref:FG-GAP repeat protein n=1 Tax=Leptospira broomii serovar Hurstbridge str. 5399 TaxID=1049789 RepID=T0F811_9LEPT|nr:FG-GAP repeat protein [Leptospira broomii serovar Hurstbridge str. 5399]